MAIEVMSGEQAWAAYRANALARWPTRQDPARLSPLASPQAHRVFGLTGQERIFCVGSCFAREIETALADLGFDVLSIMKHFPRSPNRTRPDCGMFNKYNVASILNELRWALGDGAPYRHEDVLIGAPGDLLLQDLQLAGADYVEEPGFARTFRDAFNQFFRGVHEADVVVMSLGLSEVWRDVQTGLYLNNAPSEHLVRSYPGRFELHVFDHAQTLDMLEQIDRILQAHLKPGFRWLITVSPVPLWSTFRAQDVLVANSYSKAVLRASVEAFCAGRAHVGYFPSYEFAVLSDPQAVWRPDDFRHVDPSFVEYIMTSVLAQSGQAQAASALPAVRERLLQGARRSPAAGKPRRGAGPQAVALWRGWLGRLLGAWQGRRRRSGRAGPGHDTLGHLDRWDGRTLSGWAFVASRPGPAQVEVLVDDRVVFSALADVPRDDVAQVHGDARRPSGFDVTLDPAQLSGRTLSVRVGGRVLKTLPLREA